MQSRLTTYFATRHGWQIPWQRITLRENGYALRLGSLLAQNVTATTIATPWGYEIHYREGVRECVYAHEVCHVRDMDRLGTCRYVRQYALELLTKGYRNISFEIEARKIAQEYNTYLTTRK